MNTHTELQRASVQSMRFLCIYLPMWSLEIYRKNSLTENLCDTADRELLLAATEKGQRIVKRFSADAFKRGVREGTSLPLAQALLGKVQIGEFDPIRDCHELFALARWALQFSPRVALDTELTAHLKRPHLPDISPQMNGLIIDLTGTGRLHGSEESLVQRIDSALRKAGHAARFGIARTAGAAWALSRYAPQHSTIISSEHSLSEALAPLPLQALRLEKTVVRSLKEMGLISIGDLHKLPARSLGKRFGLSLLQRMDLVRGALPEKISFITTEKQYLRSRRVMTPVTRQDTAQEIVKRLFFSVQDDLLADCRTSRHYRITFCPVRSDTSSPVSRELVLNTATSSREKTAQIIHPFIESLRVTTGIEHFIVQAISPESLKSSQGILPSLPYEGNALSQHEFDFLLNQLSVRCGADSIRQPSLRQSHLPEESWATPRYTQSSPLIAAPRNSFPSLLFRKPESISVIALLPDHAPAIINWRAHRLRVIQSLPPERIDTPWWQQDVTLPDEQRMYFKLQEQDGQWLWVFRLESTGSWYLHGLWT